MLLDAERAISAFSANISSTPARSPAMRADALRGAAAFTFAAMAAKASFQDRRLAAGR